MKSLALSVAIGLMSLASLTQVAQAHDGTDFFGGPAWADESVEYWRNELATWNNNWITSLNTADATWSNISTADGFTFILESGVNDGTDCGFAGTRSTVDKKGLDGVGGVLGFASRCDFGTPAEKFYMAMDSDDSWYHTQGDDFTNGTASAWGILTHEFGHAAGFGNGGAPQHFAGPCDDGDLFHYQTMCAAPPFGDMDNSWRWYSLEEHDIHEFTAQY